MASMAKILEQEHFLEPRIYLYREGIFWKAYQYSAFHVLQRQSSLKLKKKFIKAVSCEVISLGFPDVTLERVFEKQEIEALNEKVICIPCGELDMEAYQKWFDAVPLMEQSDTMALQPRPQPVSVHDTVLKRIKEFRIEESTPMDCMIFLVSVRKELIEYGGI